MALVATASALGAVPDRADAQSAGAGPFSDDDGSVHEPALDALALQGVLADMECGDGLICPGQPLKRWEMAVWLVRVLDGADPGALDSERFGDVDHEAWWAPSVERLFELGVTVGCRQDPLQYCPDRAVSRAQMATFLTRAFDLEAAPAAGFADVSGGSHAANIDALAAAGVTVGCSRDPLQFCPTRSVTRAQMALFLARALGLVELPAAVRFTAIDAGREHTCALRADNSAVCWGNNSYGQTDAPGADYRSVSAGWDHSCALTTDGAAVCWGNGANGQTEAPSGEFSSLAAGALHSCGIRQDQTVVCWGSNHAGQIEAPGGRFDSVSVGARHSCGVRTDAVLVCWGSNDADQSEAPGGEFRSVGSGARHSCGVRVDARVVCWGPDDHPAVRHAPSGEFSQVSVGLHHSCGVKADGSVYCWGFSNDGQAASPDGEFSAVTAGEGHSCGLLLDSNVVCWGDHGNDVTDAPAGEFTTLSSRWKHVCGLRTDGSVLCWGHQGSGRSYNPDSTFAVVSAGSHHSCGVRADGTIVCWGNSADGRTDAPSGEYRTVSAGQAHSCGLRIDGSVACWGNNHAGQSDTPSGQFSAVTTGSHHSCGVGADGSVTCWGLVGGHLEAPDGQFSAVTAGDAHSCGLRTDGTVSCWSDFSLQAAAPDGEFSAIAAGYWHTCGIRVDSTVACWGSDSWGQATPPQGSFSAVAAGYAHSCGLRSDGGIVCWGAETVAHPTGVRIASGQELPDPAQCRPYGVSGMTTAGFPRPHWVAQPLGPVRVAVLFMDFPDAPASHSTRREAELGLAFMEEYAESASYGLLDVQITPLHRWLRAQHGYVHYATGGIDAEAVRLADPVFDFSEYDVVMTVMPSSHFGSGAAFGHARTEEGAIRLTMRINFLPLPEPRQPYRWGTVAAHEFLHTLGLLDMYPSDAAVHQQAAAPSGEAWLEARFGIMTLRGYFLARERDDRVAHVWRYPDGGRSTSYSRTLDAREALAWSRWQLGWLDSDQVHCITESQATVALSPIADPGDGIAMAVIPLTAHDVVVIESRRKIGHDAGIAHVEPNGARTTFPGLASEGVLVYTVEAALAGGQLPVKLAGDTGSGRLEGYPTLSAGESVTVRGYTITVVADDGATHTVTITKTDDG